ncbi:MAG: cell division protein FtsH [Parcubacteria group bacterium RIFCSPHIGHO2_01_FULL_45_26]|nr:MAG: cell division protein FtsH [Parcubacteria group bacterium RIFCSPHIGHO2_01_FULL_45_26]
MKQFGGHILTVILIFLLLASLYGAFNSDAKDVNLVSISELARDITSDKVAKISVHGDSLTVSYKDGVERESKKELESSLSESLSNYGVIPEKLSAVSIEIASESGFGYWLINLLPILAPILFLVFFVWLISRQMKGSTMQAFSFGQSKARIIEPDDKSQKVTFADVAGVKEAKEELKEIVDFLKNPKKFLDIGARIPKGVLLMGAPGTGKTLLARAVAGEANVPFLYLSGSEFVEMFVGVGASRVRDLFKMAKKVAPSIIFVDEIDAVGRHRGGGFGGGNDEREQTLNQILVEMDGFEPNDKVIVMAATNRPDVLDPALLRPGRFDRRVVLDLPDLKDREEILHIHARKVPMFEDVNMHVIAERTPGFSGADLANLVNEAAILAAREERKVISQYDLIRSVEKVMLGPERKSHVLSVEEKRITAYHEGGHALVASVLPHADPVHKISIISRGRAAGYTLKLPLEEKRLHNRKAFLDDIATGLGGYAAEELVFQDITTGASNDIANLTAIARNMVSRYGMSELVGPVAYDDSDSLNPSAFVTAKPYSEEKAAELDRETKRIIDEGLERARAVLKKHRNALDAIAGKLVEVETIERKDFEDLLILHGIKPKKKEEPLV